MEVKEINMWDKLLTCYPNALHFKNDFFIFDINAVPFIPCFPFKINSYGFCLCLQGTMHSSIDLMPIELNEGKIVVNVPGQIISHRQASDDFKGTCVFMTKHFVDGLGLPYNFDVDRKVRENPVLDMKPGEYQAILTYCAMVKGLLEKERLYQAETLKHLTCAYTYGLGSYLYQIDATRNLTNDELLLKRFFAELRTHYTTERKVQFYATRLNITASYLSHVVKKISGTAASDWIDRFVLLEAKALLKSSNMTIQQISYELNFPSQSFFGKYFKRVTGYSPKEYRDSSLVE